MKIQVRTTRSWTASLRERWVGGWREAGEVDDGGGEDDGDGDDDDNDDLVSELATGLLMLIAKRMKNITIMLDLFSSHNLGYRTQI